MSVPPLKAAAAVAGKVPDHLYVPPMPEGLAGLFGRPDGSQVHVSTFAFPGYERQDRAFAGGLVRDASTGPLAYATHDDAIKGMQTVSGPHPLMVVRDLTDVDGPTPYYLGSLASEHHVRFAPDPHLSSGMTATRHRAEVEAILDRDRDEAVLIDFIEQGTPVTPAPPRGGPVGGS